MNQQITANRTCDQCGGAVPSRMSRQRNSKGQLVCDSCKGLTMPSWDKTSSSLSVPAQAELGRREHQAIASVSKVLRMQREGHDGGHEAKVNHCPFCGSGAVAGGSDGSVTCDFCHSTFTIQVQPDNPFMPQTVDGQPVQTPGMPNGQPTEMSTMDDPSVAESADGVAVDPMGGAGDPMAAPGAAGTPIPGADPAADPTAPPAAPGAPPAAAPGAKPNPFAKKDVTAPGGADPKDDDDPKAKGKSQPPWLKKKTSLGGLPVDDYIARLALTHADDRDDVLDAVRTRRAIASTFAEPEYVMCPHCGAEMAWSGDILGDTCPSCGRLVNTKPIEPPAEHRVVSVGGWNCDICGRGVNGQTDSDGRPLHDGEWIRHTGSKEAADDRAEIRAARDAAYTAGDYEEAERLHKSMFPDWDPTEIEGKQATQTGAAKTGRHLISPEGEWMQTYSKADAIDGHASLSKESATGLTRHEVHPTEVKVGDFLDISGKTRVHNMRHTEGRTVVAYKVRGSKSPGIRHLDHADGNVKVWRR